MQNEYGLDLEKDDIVPSSVQQQTLRLYFVILTCMWDRARLKAIVLVGSKKINAWLHAVPKDSLDLVMIGSEFVVSRSMIELLK